MTTQTAKSHAWSSADELRAHLDLHWPRGPIGTTLPGWRIRFTWRSVKVWKQDVDYPQIIYVERRARFERVVEVYTGVHGWVAYADYQGMMQ